MPNLMDILRGMFPGQPDAVSETPKSVEYLNQLKSTINPNQQDLGDLLGPRGGYYLTKALQQQEDEELNKKLFELAIAAWQERHGQTDERWNRPREMTNLYSFGQ